MSTIIIVLLVIVLVVAIVLKKRADNENTATPKKGGAAKSQKKAASKKVATKSTPIAEVETQQQTNKVQASTPVPTQLKEKIEQLILANNFQAAGAQINQALKTDDSQHDLYILLLDLHITQKDDFAIDQLIKHIHALKLDDIAQAAEAKQREYEKNKQPDAIEFSSSSSHFQQTSTSDSLAKEQNNADFDALAASKTSQSFDDLQSGYVAPAEEAKPVEPVPEVQPLDFNFSFEKKETTEATPTIEQQENKEPAPLEFSFNLDAAPATSPVVEEAKPELDFNFSNLEVTEQKTEAAPTLDFSFEPTENKQVEVTKTVTESVVELEPVQTSPQTTSVAINDPLVQIGRAHV